MLALVLGLPAFHPIGGTASPSIRAVAPIAPVAPKMMLPTNLIADVAKDILELQNQLEFQWFALPFGVFWASKIADIGSGRFYERDRRYGSYGGNRYLPDRSSMGYGRDRYGRGGRGGYYGGNFGYEADQQFRMGTRSAQEIFSDGLYNLFNDPTGWFYGNPSSPLYSNRGGYRGGYNGGYGGYGGYGGGYRNRNNGYYYNNRYGSSQYGNNGYYNSRNRYGNNGYGSNRYSGSGYSQPYYGSSRYQDRFPRGAGRVLPATSNSALSRDAQERREAWLNGPPTV